PSRPSRHSFPTRRSSDLRRQGETRAKAIVRPPTPLRGAESDRQVAGDDGAARSPGQPAGSKPPVPGEEREEEYGHAHCGSDLVARPEAVHQTLQCVTIFFFSLFTRNRR